MSNRRTALLAALLFLAAALAHTQSAVGLYDQGKRALEREEFFSAIEFFKSSLDLNNSYLDPLVGLAEAYFALAEYNEALKHIQKARVLDRFDTELAIIEGRILLGLGEFEQAEAIFNSVLAEEPHNVDAQFGLAELSIAFGKPANAAAFYERALRISPQNRRALLSLVLVFDEMGEYEVAGRYLEQVLAYYPQNATVRYVAAKHMVEQKMYADAAYHAGVALSVKPDYLDATLLLSRVHLLRDNVEAAIEILEGVLTGFSDEALIWYNLAVAYERSGRTEDAVQAYARVFTLQPDDEVARIAVENLLIDTTEIGDPRRSRFAAYHFDQGRAYLEKNYLQRALREFRRGLVLDPRSRDGRLQYASVYRLLGRTGKYYSELEVLSDLGFDDEEIMVKLEIAESLLVDTVSARWDVSQYDLVRDRYRVALFLGDGKMVHMHGETEVAEYFHHVLLGNDKLDLSGSVIDIAGFGEAFSQARTRAADYFVILTFDEGTRYFSTRWKLYSGSTGSQLAEYVVLRTGNNRVTDGIAYSATELAGKFPLYGEILAREFDTVLIDAGRVDGLEINDELIILKREALEQVPASLEFEYEDDDILGKIQITGTDELVSEGIIERDPFFDLINVGDKVIYPPEDQDETQPAVRPATDDLYRLILDIR